MKSFALKTLVGVVASCVLLVACKSSDGSASAPAAQSKAAASTPSAEPGDATQAITNALKRARPQIEITAIKPAGVAGLYAVQVPGGPTLYATADGKNFIAGELYEVTQTDLVNLTEQERSVERKALLAAIPRDQTINFTPKETKGTAFVFTDVDCFYCQKLHHGMAQMNDLGIEIRYLAYPRAGIGSPSYQKIASAWCADDKQDAINKLKNRQEIPINVCANNPVAQQFALGEQMGVHGTPSIFLTDGTMIPGYLPPAELAKRLGIK